MGAVEGHASGAGTAIACSVVVWASHLTSTVVSPVMRSNPDTPDEEKENYRKRQEGYRRQDDPDNLFKHPAVKWVPRPGSRVLMGKQRRAQITDKPVVVLTVNPSDCSCRIQRELHNRMFLLNRSKLVRDRAFADDEIIDGGSVSSMPGGIYLPLEVL